MVFRLQLPHSEITDVLDTKNFATSSTLYTFPPRIYETNDLNLMLEHLLPGDVKTKKTNDDIRQRSILSTKEM